MSLYESFRAAPPEHSMRPFWFWNAHLTPEEVQRQIEAMSAQGIHGAYAHCRSGLRPRYLTEEWWELVRAGVRKARELDFAFCMVDEYNWPSGDARDYTLERYPSRVLAVDEGFRMRSLVPSLGHDPAADYVVAGNRLASGEIDAGSLRRLEPGETGEWTVVYSFRLQDAVSFDGGLVDVMSAEAVRTFIDVVYEQYAGRLDGELGTTFRGMFVDHEGDYGYRLGWTPALPEAFRRLKGYDLVEQLPLLLEDGGPRTPVVRCDYFDVVAQLYAENFFGQLATWGEEHGIDVTGHVWEESLQAAAAFQGDHFRVQRAFTTPGIDSLFEWGRLPRHFLEARSVAHFRERGLVVENQGVQGAESYLSPERIKRTTNMIANWGTTLFVPHALNGNPDRIDFPEDWFEQQPWWRFFHHYADYVTRLSFMNSGGRHVCELALLYPIESVWAHGDPCFSAEKWDYIFSGADNLNGPRVTWNNPADEVDRVYGEIIETLPARQWDLDILDAHYLSEAEIGDGRLRIAQESFGVLILPPMTCMRLAAARRVREFRESGGLVVAVGALPTDSMENGRADPALARELEALAPLRADDVEGLVALLEKRVPKDVQVLQGSPEHLFFLHRVKDGRDVYYFVNDTDATRRVVVSLMAEGQPQLWDPDGGERRLLPARASDSRTELELAFEPWQAYYVVFEGSDPLTETETRADAAAGPPPLVLAGTWRMTPELGETPAPYARTATCREGEGLALGWHRPDFNDHFWPEEWLSNERFTLRDWWVVGPFDYHDHLGYNEIYPPERGVDLDATYEGRDGRQVGWRRFHSPERVVDLDEASGLHLEHWGGMQFKTSYAWTQVESDEARELELRITGDSNAKAWLNGEPVLTERDDHQGYLEHRDAFGFRLGVHLHAGTNHLLLKVSQAMRYGGTFGFVARFCDAEGYAVPGVQAVDAAGEEPSRVERWYRVPVPAGATGVDLPSGAAPEQLYLDGEPVEGSFQTAREGVLALRFEAGEELQHSLRFRVGAAERPLGSLTHTGLSFYAGTFRYEKSFELPPEYLGQRLLLDLGDVGVAAEVWLNETRLGERVWRPFTLEVTSAVKQGTNTLRAVVANTRANERARGPDQLALWAIPVRGRALLDEIDLNGLQGPVRLLAQKRAPAATRS